LLNLFGRRISATHSRSGRRTRRGWRFLFRWGKRNDVETKEELPEGKIKWSGNLDFCFNKTVVYDLLLAVEIISTLRCNKKARNSLSLNDLTVSCY
jgi:hypothetical protein